MEDYLACVTDVRKRMLISCLRAGVLRLRIESGRYEKNGLHAYSGVPIEYRVCILCKKAKVEDEIHFLCECEVYEDERKHLKRVCKKELKLKLSDWKDGQMCFIKIMQAKSSRVLKTLGDFVFVAYSIRTAKLKEIELK